METLTVKIENDISKKVRIFCIANEIKLRDFVQEAITKELYLRQNN